MVKKLKGIIRKPARPVSTNDMNEAVAKSREGWAAASKAVADADAEGELQAWLEMPAVGREFGARRPARLPDHHTDFILWATEQATLLRDGRLAKVDRHNVAEELDTLARALRRELQERIVRLLQNLVQWDYLDGLRLPAWYAAIVGERDMIPRILKDAPSLRATLADSFAPAWQQARERASGATGLSDPIFPGACPYTLSQALDAAFWPGEWNNNHAGPTRLELLRGSVRRYDNPTDSVWSDSGEPKENQ